MSTEPTVVRPDGALSVEDGAREFDWLLSSFASRTPGIIDALGVSSDGLLIASSAGLRRPSAEQLAAIVSGMLSSASERLDASVFSGSTRSSSRWTAGYSSWPRSPTAPPSASWPAKTPISV